MSFKDDIDEMKKQESGEWVKLVDGQQKFRVLSEPAKLVQYYDPTQKKYFTCYTGSCDGKKVTVKFLTWVIDRADGQIKLFKMPNTIAKAVRELMLNEDYAFDQFPMPYDVTISAKGAGTIDAEYTVLPSPKLVPVTDEELELVEKQHTPADIIKSMKEKQKRLDGIIEEEKTTEPMNKIEYPVDEDGERINPNDIPF